MAAWAVGFTTCRLGGLHVDLDTRTAEIVLALRSDGVFGDFIANVADEDILAAFGRPFQQQIWVVGNLTHLHDETKNVGVVVEHNVA